MSKVINRIEQFKPKKLPELYIDGNFLFITIYRNHEYHSEILRCNIILNINYSIEPKK